MCPPHRRQALYTRARVPLSGTAWRPYIGGVFGSRSRAAVTTAVVLEVGIAGWALGYGALWLLMMTVTVTVADTIWGVFRRRVPADIAGLEVALALGRDGRLRRRHVPGGDHGRRVLRMAHPRRPNRAGARDLAARGTTAKVRDSRQLCVGDGGHTR